MTLTTALKARAFCATPLSRSRITTDDVTPKREVNFYLGRIRQIDEILEAPVCKKVGNATTKTDHALLVAGDYVQELPITTSTRYPPS